MTVCNNHHEDVYLPNQLHSEASHDRGLYLGHVSRNISLHQACMEGKLCMVQFILSHRPADINSRDKLGRTPVMAAVMMNHVTVFDFLVKQSCDLMAVDNNNDTVLHVACEVGNVDVVRKLVVNKTCDIESRGDKGRTPVMKSALHGHRVVLDLLVRKGCNVTILDEKTNNILHVACLGGHVDMVKYVLKKLNSDIESRGEKGRTPVMVAAHSGHAGVFDFLVSNGSNLFAVDDNEDNILHVACIGGQEDMVQHILNKTSIRIESEAKHGRTPVMRAVEYGQRSVVDFLDSQHCNLTTVDNDMNTVLHIGCIAGHLDMVKHILSKNKIPIDSRGQYGRTPVMLAATKGHLNIVLYLVSTGCDLSTVDFNGDNILHFSCLSRSVDMVKYIISETKLSIESRRYNGHTPVMIATSMGHLNIVKYLVSKGCNLSIVAHKGNTILHLACMSVSVDMVKYIISQTKISIDSRGQFGRTPVMVAASKCHLGTVKYLVSKGCDLSFEETKGNTILHVACMCRSVDMVKYIMSQTKLAIDCRGYVGWTPVMIAASLGRIDVVKYLVSTGCDLSMVNLKGENILHVACMSGWLYVVKYIITQTKVSIDSRGQFGRTPVMVAAYRGHLSVAKYLVSKDCNLSMEDFHGNNFLHVACMSGNVDMVKYIISQTKISINSRGQSGYTPVMAAASKGHLNIFKYLIAEGCNLFIVSNDGNNVLHLASAFNHVDIVKYIVSQTNISIDSRGEFGRTAVVAAANFGHKSILMFLLNRGCKVMILDETKNNILHVACLGGHVDIVEYIVEKLYISIESRGYMGTTPVMAATYFGHRSVVEYLVRKGCKLANVDKNGRNVLELACMKRHYDLVKYLFTIKSWSKTC